MTDPAHPATFSDPLLPALRYLTPPGLVLDPFGGVGTIGRLGDAWTTISAELEPEWARQGPANGCTVAIVADTLALPFADDTIPAIATSPAYGNRIADRKASRTQFAPAGKRKRSDRVRRTYVGYLGRDIDPARSGAVLQWGRRYREFHTAAIAEWARVLRPGGHLILNVKDHYRTVGPKGARVRKLQEVTAWWYGASLEAGFTGPDTEIRILLKGDQNTNRDRAKGLPVVEHESVARFRLG